MSSKTKADIWKFYELDGDRKKTKCNLCNALLSYTGGTSTMRNHMKFHHKKIELSKETFTGSEKRQTSMIDFHKSRCVAPICIYNSILLILHLFVVHE